MAARHDLRGRELGHRVPIGRIDARMSFTYHLPPGWSTTAAPCCGASCRRSCRSRRVAVHEREQFGRVVGTIDPGRRCCSVHERLRTAIAASNTEPVHHHSSARFVPGCPGADGPLPIPCSIVRHKPTTRAVLEPNKPHRSDLIVGLPFCTEVTFSHIRHSLGSAAVMGHSATVTRYIVIRNDPHRGSALRCKIFIVAGNRPWTVRTGRFSSIRSVINTRPSMFPGRAGPAHRLPAYGDERDQRCWWGKTFDNASTEVATHSHSARELPSLRQRNYFPREYSWSILSVVTVPLTLLGLLERGPSHGYDLKRDYDAFFGRGRPLRYSQVYATLSRLARDGKAVAGPAEKEAGPERRRYVITEAGIADVEHWLTEPVAPEPDLQSELFAKVVLALMLGRPAVSYLDAQRAAHLQRMRELTELKRDSDYLGVLLADHALYRLEADLRWIDHTAARLDLLARAVPR